MASTSPYYSSVYNTHTIIPKKRRPLLLPTTSADPPFGHIVLLFLSSLLILALIFLNLQLLSPSVSFLHYLSSPLSTFNQVPLSSFTATQLLQHHLTFLLSPFPIFILANLIIFTILFKTFYLSSSSVTPVSDFSDFPSVKSDYGGAQLPEYGPPVQSHEDFFLSSPPHAHYLVSSDPAEEYHVLSFGCPLGDQPTSFRTLQKLNYNEWQQVKGPDFYSIHNSSSTSKDQAKRQDNMMVSEKLQMPISCKMSNMVQGRQSEKKEGFDNNGKFDGGRSCISQQEITTNCSSVMAGGTTQAIVISMDSAMTASSRRPRSSTPTSHPPPPPLALAPAPSHSPPPTRKPAIKVPLSNTSTNILMQRPPSSPRAKKTLHQNTRSAVPTPDHGRSNGASAAKPLILDNDKQAHAKPQSRRSVHQHQSRMVRSYSDQRLSQRNSSPSDVTNVTSSLTNRPAHVLQKAPSARSIRSSAIDVLLTSSSLSANKPQMQRSQSLRSSRTPPEEKMAMVPSASPQHHVTRSPSFSEALDGLSNADANKRFANFIAHRFALMKEELHSTG
ncbi:hypothetical protein GOP47_0025999 [Adiantum capillus-veneris]|uniref:Uncharacterized protein n=1 Tax=Adiantum capillus-veneris TaxID=13818 RepID=A0A9D4Z3D0_ADICA|nr:hypothetical protein GOP47_0025999 [Adiantum capillus-veneris]